MNKNDCRVIVLFSLGKKWMSPVGAWQKMGILATK
jgi:hypothetical protein